jgi:hypothetical protein
MLKASFEKNCIGCELCVLEVQRQLGKVGLDGSLVRILRDKDAEGKIIYKVDIDPAVNALNIKKIIKICPALVFTLEGKEDEHELTD